MPVTNFEQTLSIDTPVVNQPRNPGANQKDLHYYSNLTLLRHPKEFKTCPTNSALLFPFSKLRQAKQGRICSGQNLITIKMLPYVQMTIPSFEATMSSSSFSSLRQILPEFHHFRATFPPQKAPPHSKASSSSEDIALRSSPLPQIDTFEINYSPGPPMS